MQYTIRNIPAALDDRLRQQAREERTSLNDIVVRLLTRALGLSDATARQRDLGDLAGTWQDDPAFEAALLDQDTVDPDLWR
jgi:hypothetical protein